MCGIVAYSGKKNYNIDKLKSLLIVNSILRGKDATGFFNRKQGVVKKNLDCQKFFESNELESDNIFIGHVRAATSGEKIDKNAHPFEFDKLIGVHNGTLKNVFSFASSINISNQNITVDSEMLYKILNDTQNINNISNIDGAMALVWYDKVTDYLNVYKNDERPLYRGKIDDEMYISSIPEMLVYIGCKSVKEFKNETLYKIKDGKIVEFKKNIKKYVSPEIEKDDLSGVWVVKDSNNYVPSLSIRKNPTFVSTSNTVWFNTKDVFHIVVYDRIKENVTHNPCYFFKTKIIKNLYEIVEEGYVSEYLISGTNYERISKNTIANKFIFGFFTKDVYSKSNQLVFNQFDIKTINLHYENNIVSNKTFISQSSENDKNYIFDINDDEGIVLPLTMNDILKLNKNGTYLDLQQKKEIMDEILNNYFEDLSNSTSQHDFSENYEKLRSDLKRYLDIQTNQIQEGTNLAVVKN